MCLSVQKQIYEGTFSCPRRAQLGKGTLKRPCIFNSVSLTLLSEAEEKPCETMWQQLYGRQEVDEEQSFPQGNSSTEGLGADGSLECYICVKTSPALRTFFVILRLNSTMEKKLENLHPHSKEFLANI